MLGYKAAKVMSLSPTTKEGHRLKKEREELVAPPQGIEMPVALFAAVVLVHEFTHAIQHGVCGTPKRPYGEVEILPNAPQTPEEIETAKRNMSRNYAAGKSKLAVWFVSHCKTDSRREFYVHLLKQHANIDIFGKCGKPFCPFDQLNDCYERIEIDYKFYLSLENSLCRDYITEKFFNLLDRNIVPVVYGAGDYEKVAPPHSYIDALKYTPQQLAEYLNMLDKNDTAYNEYFWWKPYYK